MATPIVKRCVSCRSDLIENQKSPQCDKCKKNEAKYGKPTICKFCQIHAAFHEDKCVYCSHSQRKFGDPVACASCKLKSAFVKDSKNKGKPTLCRLCIMNARQHKMKVMAGVVVSSSEKASSSVVATDKDKHGHKRKHDEKDETNNKVSKSDPLAEAGENVLVVQQLRDQIARMQATITQKDSELLNRDKKIAALNAELMDKEKKFREKISQMMKEKEEAVNAVHEKYRQMKIKEKK
ncbi:hypothetical protein WR25_21910 [Diploscapter pachys]|uniref:Protein FAM76A n=1 Tax=Diploscapter pachys TaxID=2018661 RepID=A0A2A2LYV3_9BILA|nr:hypothetical protein WR25_21910 [Diploscapter pachys]